MFNENDLVRRGDVKEECLKLCFYPALVNVALIRTPAVDAVEVVHGRWINRQNWSVTCSVCGSLGIAHDGKNYCPYCGGEDGRREGKMNDKFWAFLWGIAVGMNIARLLMALEYGL